MVPDDPACPAASKPLARLGYLFRRGTAPAIAQLPEVLDKAYDSELERATAATQTYAGAASPENLRAALATKLRLALVLSWTAQGEAQQGDFEGARETYLEALDLSRFVFDASSNDETLTGIHAAAEAVDEDIVTGVESLRSTNPSVTSASTADEVDDADRITRTQIATRAIEAFLDDWESRSRRKTFDGADVIEAVDGSTTVEVRADREAWLSRSESARRQTFEVVVNGVASAVSPGPLGFVLKFVDRDGATLIAVRVPRNLVKVPF